MILQSCPNFLKICVKSDYVRVYEVNFTILSNALTFVRVFYYKYVLYYYFYSLFLGFNKNTTDSYMFGFC